MGQLLSRRLDGSLHGSRLVLLEAWARLAYIHFLWRQGARVGYEIQEELQEKKKRRNTIPQVMLVHVKTLHHSEKKPGLIMQVPTLTNINCRAHQGPDEFCIDCCDEKGWAVAGYGTIAVAAQNFVGFPEPAQEARAGPGASGGSQAQRTAAELRSNVGACIKEPYCYLHYSSWYNMLCSCGMLHWFATLCWNSSHVVDACSAAR